MMRIASPYEINLQIICNITGESERDFYFRTFSYLALLFIDICIIYVFDIFHFRHFYFSTLAGWIISYNR
jgi:hypothetical protein